MDAMIEISLRRFYTCEDGGVTPTIRAVVPVQALVAGTTNWPGLAEKVAEQVKELHFEGLREMTPSEVKAYREEGANHD
jgi:hypothetical protein